MQEVSVQCLKAAHLFCAAASLRKPKGTGASRLRVERKETHPQHFRGSCVFVRVRTRPCKRIQSLPR